MHYGTKLKISLWKDLSSEGLILATTVNAIVQTSSLVILYKYPSGLPHLMRVRDLEKLGSTIRSYPGQTKWGSTQKTHNLFFKSYGLMLCNFFTCHIMLCKIAQLFVTLLHIPKTFTTSKIQSFMVELLQILWFHTKFHTFSNVHKFSKNIQNFFPWNLIYFVKESL